MIINHNLMANNAIRNMNINSTNASKSMAKLSSGLRINNAADDAAGLAISEKMRGQIRGLNQASSNAQDGISLVQTAEGALNETTSILQRMRELAVQSSNGTATDDDRASMQKEVAQLKNEIDRISTQTEFNTKKLLNGDVAGQLSAQGTNLNSTKLTAFARATGQAAAAADASSENGKNIVINGTTVNIAALASGTATQTATAVRDLINNTSGIGVTASINASDELVLVGKTAGQDISISGSADLTKLGFGTTTSASSSVTGSTLMTDLADSNGNTLGLAGTETITGTVTVGGVSNNASSLTITTTSTLQNFIDDANTDMGNVSGDTVNTDGSVQFQGAAGLTNALSNMSFTVSGKTTFNNAFSNFSEVQAAQDAHNDSSLSFHIGANQNQTMAVDINNMSVQALSLTGVNVSTIQGAESAISVIDNATKAVSTERSKLGAFQNRLEHTINNLGTSSENLTSAESRIRDVDMASEMSTFSKNNILSQAAQAMLAQANQQPQQVLQLLR